MRKMLSFTAVSAVIIFSLFLFIAGCQKEVEGTIDISPVPADQEKVTGNIRGIVVDENNIPVQGATVSAGTFSTTTDRYGSFRIDNISLSKNNGYVKVSKPGYFNGSRSFVSTAGRTHNVRIKLLPKINSGSFPGAAGGMIDLSGGAKMLVPAAAVTDGNGNAYTGTVNVAMTWIDPSSGNLPYTMPGDLRGITASGEERGLQTFGMIGVEMTGSGGQELKIATGKTAELQFPIPASLLVAAQPTIDLWHFDELAGRWKQEGQAVKNGNYYIAQVAHFSFWNCDAPFPLIDLCMTLIGPHNTGLNNVAVRIKRPNGSYGYGRTDSLGNLCGKMPRDEALVLEILDQCDNVVVSQNIGPFSSNASLGNINVTLPAAQSLTITGTVQNCTNSNIANGAVSLYTAAGNIYSAPVTNGNFSLTLLNCGSNNLVFSFVAIDMVSLQQSAPVSGSGVSGTINVGTVQACGVSAAEFVELLIDGAPYNFVSPPDNIYPGDSSLTGGPPASPMQITAFSYTVGNNTNYCMFRVNNNGATGTFPLLSNLFNWTPLFSQQIVTANPVINITTFGPPATGFIEGNFIVQMDFGGTVKTVNCNFKVRRD